MYRYIAVFLLVLSSNQIFGQTKRLQKQPNTGEMRKMDLKRGEFDTISGGASKKVAKNTKAKIEDYKIITRKHDTVHVDTTLNIKKEYKFNYLRKDYFDLLPFNNMGQTYNTLSRNMSGQTLSPSFAAQAKHFNYMDVDAIRYYHVPTPLTELMFKSNFEQGQLLDAFFTVNTSKEFNFSIAYKGMRSLGKYQHILSSTGNFRFTSSYQSKNKRYRARAHMVTQDILNQENGGISDEDLLEFENGNEEFIDRSLFDPLFENAENNLEGRRFYLDQVYQLKSNDTLGYNGINIGSTIYIEDKYYQFKQDQKVDFFGDAFVSSKLTDKNTFEHFYTALNVDYTNKTIGRLSAQLGYNSFNYGYDALVILDGQTISNRLKESTLSFEGGYDKQLGPVLLKADLGINVAGDLEGNYLNAQADYQINSDLQLMAKLNMNSTAANYNYRLHQSDYLNYNWQNNFKNQQTQQLAFELSSYKYGTLSVDYSTISNFLFFENKENQGVKPYQYDGTINYARFKYEKEFKFGNFALNNTLLYQQVFEGDQVFNVPQINTRNTFYYSNTFFDKALFLQTGINFHYFTAYNMNAYDPILAEFYIQNQKSLGDFPRLDFFINAKIQQTRLFLKAEHFNSAMTGYNFYSAPNYPYRDFIVRFGLVWNFFL